MARRPGAWWPVQFVGGIGIRFSRVRLHGGDPVPVVCCPTRGWLLFLPRLASYLYEAVSRPSVRAPRSQLLSLRPRLPARLRSLDQWR